MIMLKLLARLDTLIDCEVVNSCSGQTCIMHSMSHPPHPLTLTSLGKTKQIAVERDQVSAVDCLAGVSVMLETTLAVTHH